MVSCGCCCAECFLFFFFCFFLFFFFQAEDGIRDWSVTGVQTCALPIYLNNIVPKSQVSKYNSKIRLFSSKLC